jgi:hypothetical protein
MDQIVKYFWFLCAAVMALNVLIFRRRLLALVDHGNATRPEVDRFVRWLGVWIIGGPIIFGISVLAAGWSSPLCALGAPSNSAPRVLMSAYSVATGALLLLWIWRGNGADFLARTASAFTRRSSRMTTYPASYVRTFVTLLVLVGAVVGVVQHRSTTQSQPAPAGCPGAHTAS